MSGTTSGNDERKYLPGNNRRIAVFFTCAQYILWCMGEPLFHPNIIEMVRQAKSLGSKVELITNGLC
jgi:MoaA/NifB/PqqE/SkfB family radical SAM enzyme